MITGYNTLHQTEIRELTLVQLEGINKREDKKASHYNKMTSNTFQTNDEVLKNTILAIRVIVKSGKYKINRCSN